jgi:phosphopantothenoylcysteine synthetase/decarboxylase
MGNLSIVVCGAPLAARAHDVVAAAQVNGWHVSLLVTESARAWVEGTSASSFRRPDEPKPARPDAVLVLPMTFNTGNKWALGLADSRPLALLAETLGAGKPCVAVPMVNDSLWGHPAWARSLRVLGDARVRFVDPATGEAQARPVASGSGEDVTADFQPEWAIRAL